MAGKEEAPLESYPSKSPLSPPSPSAPLREQTVLLLFLGCWGSRDSGRCGGEGALRGALQPGLGGRGLVSWEGPPVHKERVSVSRLQPGTT